MKMLRIVIVLGLIAYMGDGYSQDVAFKVMANKGTNEVKSGDSWQPIKTGASLKLGDELKLADNGYLGLIHVTGKPVEVKKAGPYKVADLAAEVKGGSSALNKYTDFILSSNSDDKKGKLGATGAVHRDIAEAKAIKLMLPENQHSGVYNNEAVITWDASKVKGPYVVTLSNMFEDQLAKIETAENSIKINLNDPKFVNETGIFVDVRSKADPAQSSKMHLIKKLSPEARAKVQKSLNEIMGEVSEQTALNKFILAGFYEEQGLFIDAIAAYEEAIKLAPDVTYYQETYSDFLIRHGLKKP
ncbi:MAG: hypothetical protein KF725_14585 [Cyclobacteriaceae bacterium]|nr:hypothetical protein [Cyclobacteriaceae bacterium]UYN87416.1 MAG: hypothetical protein KIT51_03870 [Cyclobacteriaceae bacterium]